MDWRAWRDRWIGDADTRRRLARWPGGGRIARRHADDLFGIVAGFVRSQWLAAAVELAVFAALRDGPRDWPAVVGDRADAAALLQGLIATGLVERRGGQVGLTVAGLVVASDPGLRTMIAHNRLLYADMGDPVAMLVGRDGAVARLWPYVGGGGDPAVFSELMSASNAMVSDAVTAAVDFARVRHVMDVGGGTGAFLRTLAARYPALALTLVDHPAVIARADDSARRIRTVAARDDGALPGGADVATLLRVLHDQGDAAAARLLARVADALPRGGRIVVAEPMARAGRDPQTAYFAAYFVAMRSGRLRTVQEVGALLREAGFGRVRARQRGPLATVMTATRV